MRIRQGDVAGDEATRLLDAYFAYRAAAFPGPGAYRLSRPDATDYAPGRGVFLLVEDDDRVPVGCAGVRLLAPRRAEVKHVWLDPAARGRGWADTLMDEVERRADALGAAELVLDTHRTLEPAARLYARHGFAPIEPYNDNPNATAWLRKALG